MAADPPVGGLQPGPEYRAVPAWGSHCNSWFLTAGKSCSQEQTAAAPVTALKGTLDAQRPSAHSSLHRKWLGPGGHCSRSWSQDIWEPWSTKSWQLSGALSPIRACSFSQLGMSSEFLMSPFHVVSALVTLSRSSAAFSSLLPLMLSSSRLPSEGHLHCLVFVTSPPHCGHHKKQSRKSKTTRDNIPLLALNVRRTLK